ncbi:MAG: hypothetical protein ABSB21_03905 [Halobacteriota archaeon]
MSRYGYIEPDLDGEKIKAANKKYEGLTKQVVDIIYKIMEDEKGDNRRRILDFRSPMYKLSAYRSSRRLDETHKSS